MFWYVIMRQKDILINYIISSIHGIRKLNSAIIFNPRTSDDKPNFCDADDQPRSFFHPVSVAKMHVIRSAAGFLFLPHMFEVRDCNEVLFIPLFHLYLFHFR
jgi:hypothetical protein